MFHVLGFRRSRPSPLFLLFKNPIFLGSGKSSQSVTVTHGVRGLDSTDQSVRDVFNDVSKYIGTISISLNRVFRTFSLSTRDPHTRRSEVVLPDWSVQVRLS